MRLARSAPSTFLMQATKAQPALPCSLAGVRALGQGDAPCKCAWWRTMQSHMVTHHATISRDHAAMRCDVPCHHAW
eukprot:364696-Chlamydomonas_euryale.AAC.11